MDPVDCKSVLIVEDDDLTRDALSIMLQEDGYQVLCAENGQAALEQLQRTRPPGLILLDMMMPVMTGWEFLTQRKQDPRLAAIPVVICSGTGDAARQAASLGAAGYLKKPIEFQVLLATIRRYC